MTEYLPEEYRLGKIAQGIARRRNIELKRRDSCHDTLLDVLRSFRNPTDHLVNFLVHKDPVYNLILLLSQKDKRTSFFYFGGTSKNKNKPIEAVYSEGPNRIIVTTYGYPEDVGVLEVTGLEESIALQELSGVSEGMGGPYVRTVIGAPLPHPYKGVALFGDKDFDKLSKTIEILSD